METEKEHFKLIRRIDVLETKIQGNFDKIIDHLGRLNGRTEKNSEDITELQKQDNAIFRMVSEQGQNEKQFYQREDDREKRRESMRRRWEDLLFSVLKWAIPILIIATLLRGKDILEFLNVLQ